jgi:4-hydroxybenzoate polyprenyltransferase
VLGKGLDYLLHLRPAEWPIMAGHTLLGAVLALGLAGFLRREQMGAVLLGLVLWVVALNGGTLAINSAFDRDEGDVAYLRRPPPPPPGLFAFGLGLMVLGLVLAAVLLPLRFALLYTACLTMSVLYSVPPVRLKSVAGADWVINLVGFGALTPLAGWASTGVPLTRWGLLLAIGFGALFAALYPLTQLYQFDEDSRRGDRTFALAAGKKASLGIAIGCAVLAFAIFGWAVKAPGGNGRGMGGASVWIALAVALGGWLVVLLPWRRDAERMTPAAHQRGMHLALAAWALTDVAVLIGWG